MTHAQSAHLVGSAPVDEPDELLALVRDHLADHRRSVPEGEIGERDTWLAWQFPKLSQCPQLETRSVNSAYLGREVPQHEIADGAGPLELVDLGNADAALASWEQFAAAQDAGTLPKQRDDDAYFEALGAVEIPDEIELYLGLVHVTGGQEGTRRRIATASRHVPRFGLATECGFGRRPISQIPALLDQHAALSAPWDA